MPTRTTVPGSGGTDDTAGAPLHKTGIDKFPGGSPAYLDVSASAVITTIADIGTQTFPALANRTYLVMAQCRVQSTVANDVIEVRITDGSNTSLRSSQCACPVANSDEMLTFFYLDQPSGGSVTYKLRGQRVSGTGTCTANASSHAFLVVLDIAPAF